MDKPENPAAFPMKGHTDALTKLNFETQSGMTLRDYFAAKALPACMEQGCAKDGATWESCIDATATLSYLIADAMLKARDND